MESKNFKALPQGTPAFEDVTQAWTAANEGQMSLGSLITVSQSHFNGAKTKGEKIEVAFRLAASYEAASALWDTAYPLSQFADGVERNKAKTKALHAPLSYLNRVVLREQLGVEIARAGRGAAAQYGLKTYTAPDVDPRKKALDEIARALAKLDAKAATKAEVMKLVDAHFNAKAKPKAKAKA